MAIELRILTGARAGQTERFETSVIAIGRHPLSDLRFDAMRDLDVSARHAAIHEVNGGYAIQDAASTNGTLVNGERLLASNPRVLRDGDVIAFGAQGPTVAVHLGGTASARRVTLVGRARALWMTPAADPPAARAPDAPRRVSTDERVAAAVRRQTRRLRTAALAGGAGAAALAAIGIWIGHRESAAHKTEVERLVAAYNQASQQLRQRLEGTHDSTLINDLTRRNDSLVRAVRAARGHEAVVAQQALQRSHDVTRALSRMDLPALHQANDAGVVLISSDIDGETYEATGFAVRSSGLVVTSRHVVSDSAGRLARVRVKFADTHTWHPAHVLKLDDDPTVDLALVDVDDRGPFPTVYAVAPVVDVPVGAAIATLGFPLGTDMPMERVGTSLVAKTTLTPGTVSKSVRDVLQIDSFASHGSSGSPVLDAHDHVIGVVSGGQKGTGGRIVFAVPSDRITELLKTVR